MSRMLNVRASTHQANLKFSGAGRQCVAVSLAAFLYTEKTDPMYWTTHDLDTILEDGNKLYMKCNVDKFLLIDDLPQVVKPYLMHIRDRWCGTIFRAETTAPFYTIDDALRSIETYGFLTINCYTVAVVKCDDAYYVFDSHSRSPLGMNCPENGTAVLSMHENLEELTNFIKNLSSSLFEEDKPFELTNIKLELYLAASSSSEHDFSGYSQISDGEYSYGLAMPQEQLKELQSKSQSGSDSCDNIPLSVLQDKLAESTRTKCDELSLDYCSSGSEYNFSAYEHKIISGDIAESEPSSSDFENKACRKKSKSKKRRVRQRVVLEKKVGGVGQNEESVEVGGVVQDEESVEVGGVVQDEESVEVGGVVQDEESVEVRCVVQDEQSVEVGGVVQNEESVEVGGVVQDEESVEVGGVVQDEESVEVGGVVQDEESVEVGGVVHDEESVEVGGVVQDKESVEVGGVVQDEECVEVGGVVQDEESVEVGGVVQNEESVEVGGVVQDEESVEIGGVVQDEESVEVGDDSGIRRGRKRVRDESLWKRQVRKRRKDSGEEYKNERGIPVRARRMGEGCGTSCRFKCKAKITSDQRKDIFHTFWGLGDTNFQREFILKHAKSEKKQTGIAKETSRRSNSVKWNLPMGDSVIRVCKTFFLHTLDISDQVVITANNKVTSIGTCQKDMRGKHKNRPHKTSDIQSNFVRAHILSFPTVESHYCRKKTQKRYLSADLSLAKMYRLYLEKCANECKPPVQQSVYRKIFDHEFNFAFHKPLKDMCDLCTTYKNADPVYKMQLENKFQTHLKNKTAARENKLTDKENARTFDNSLVVACFDLQEVLSTPKSFESALYYKRKLSSFNFSIYDLGSSAAFCYIWNETIGKRGASDISSCVYHFIKRTASLGKTKIIFYSDNCAGQNKNRFYMSMLWYCLQKFNLTSLQHKYLEKGHTQNEGDSVHATIEHASKNISIYTTGQWATLIRAARSARPYTVIEMSNNSFYDFSDVSRNLKNFDLNSDGNKVYMSDIKTFRIGADEPNMVFFQYEYGGPEYQMNLTKRVRHSNTLDPKEIPLSRLYDRPIAISSEKYQDLVSLCRAGIIPNVYHPMYLLLPHSW